MSRSEIRIAGAGGQGVVTAGRILAEAAILSGSNATHNQVYGPQSRGGASRSDVVIAGDEIGFPLADEIDLLIALSGEAFGPARGIDKPKDCAAYVAGAQNAITAAAVVFVQPGSKALKLDSVEPSALNVQLGAYLLQRPLILRIFEYSLTHCLYLMAPPPDPPIAAVRCSPDFLRS